MPSAGNHRSAKKKYSYIFEIYSYISEIYSYISLIYRNPDPGLGL